MKTPIVAVFNNGMITTTKEKVVKMVAETLERMKLYIVDEENNSADGKITKVTVSDIMSSEENCKIFEILIAQPEAMIRVSVFAKSEQGNKELKRFWKVLDRVIASETRLLR